MLHLYRNHLFRDFYYSKSIPLQQYESIYEVLQNINLFAIQHKRQKNIFSICPC